MPLVVAHDNATVHIHAVHLEGHIERVQQCRMIRVADVFSIELPVIVDDLAMHAQGLKRPVKITLDHPAEFLTEIFLHGRHVVGE